MDVKLYPSVMCMDFSRLREEIRSFESAGVDGFHVDVMDGSFVKDCSPDGYVASVRACTSLPLDVHLMVRRPADYLEEVCACRPETIYVHAEAQDVTACLQKIPKISEDCRVGLAVSPETQLDEKDSRLLLVNQVLILRVKPGCCGQPAIPQSESKIGQLLHFPQRRYNITCDGAVTSDFIAKWRLNDVKHFVCGMASGLFPIKDKSPDERRKQIHTLRGI